MRNITCLILVLGLFACTKYDTPAPEQKPLINVAAAVGVDTVTTGGATFKYWKATAIIDKMVVDTCYVVVQWDAYSAPGHYESTMRDTVPIMPHQSGSVSHRSRIVYMHPWFAQDVKVVYAWSKNLVHHFKF